MSTESSPASPGSTTLGALGLVMAAGCIGGALDVLLLAPAELPDPLLMARVAALGALVTTGLASLVALPAAVCGGILRRSAAGTAGAAALLTPPLLVLLRWSQWALDAPATSATGLAAAAALGLPMALLALAVGPRTSALLGQRSRGLAAGGVGGLILAAVMAMPASAPGQPRAPAVILISIDSVRADVWERYLDGHASPELTRFANASARFSRASTTWSHSLPSHASMLTGLWPANHGARIHSQSRQQQGSPLHEDVQTMAQQLRQSGAQSAGFADNAWLGDPYGLHRGLGTFVNGARLQRLGHYAPAPALALSSGGSFLSYAANRLHLGAHPSLAMALSWWDNRDPQVPTLLFVHLIEQHVPNDPAAVQRARFATGPYADLGGTELDAMLESGTLTPQQTADAITQLHALSMASLAELDAMLVPLLAGLQARAVTEHSLVILTSDHGDNLWEREGDYGHSHVWQATAHVPLLIAGPGVSPGLRTEPVSLVDIAPTFFAFLGLAPATPLDGRDLRAPGLGQPRPIVVEGHDVADPGVHQALLLDPYKLVVDRDDPPALFDLSADPHEQHDLAVDQPERVAELTSRLSTIVAPVSGAVDRAVDVDDLPPEVAEELRALGYIE